MTDKAGLADLAMNYPPGSRGLGTRVLREYAQITSARRHGWSWADIVSAMDPARARGKLTNRGVLGVLVARSRVPRTHS